MSASLVGSEMCIRDSRCSSRGAVAPPDPPMVRPARVRGASWRGFGGAVSYTHLTLPTICSV
eukprot:10732011-Alexandrium_andersonii.AAC.1